MYSMTTKTYYYAGAPHVPGTSIPANVTGNCPHKHRTPDTAQRCIDKLDQSIKRGHTHGYADRVVMIHDDDGRRVVMNHTPEWRRVIRDYHADGLPYDPDDFVQSSRQDH